MLGPWLPSPSVGTGTASGLPEDDVEACLYSRRAVLPQCMSIVGQRERQN